MNEIGVTCLNPSHKGKGDSTMKNVKIFGLMGLNPSHKGKGDSIFYI